MIDPKKFKVMAQVLSTGVVFEAHPLKAIADIASQLQISNEDAENKLLDQFFREVPDIICLDKDVDFWLETI